MVGPFELVGSVEPVGSFYIGGPFESVGLFDMVGPFEPVESLIWFRHLNWLGH